MAVQEIERAVGHDVGLEALDLSPLAVVNELRVAVGTAAAGHRGPVGEARLRGVVLAHVPLAAHAQRVAGVGQDFGVGAEAVQPAVAGRAVAVCGMSQSCTW